MRGAVEERFFLVAVDVVHVLLAHAADQDRGVVVRRAHHGDDAAGLDVHHHGAAALVDEQTLGERLHFGVDGEREAGAALRLDVQLAALVRLHLHAVHVHQHELAPDAPAEHVLVLALDAVDAHLVAQAVALLAHHVEPPLVDLLDVAERVAQACLAVVTALLVFGETEPAEPVLVFLQAREGPERHVPQQHVGLVGGALLDLVVAPLDLGERPARQFRHQRQVVLFEVARAHRHAQRSLVVHHQDAVAVRDVAARRPDDLRLHGVALGLGGVLLVVDKLHLRQPHHQHGHDGEHHDREHAVAQTRLFSGRGGEGGGHRVRGLGGACGARESRRGIHDA